MRVSIQYQEKSIHNLRIANIRVYNNYDIAEITIKHKEYMEVHKYKRKVYDITKITIKH